MPVSAPHDHDAAPLSVAGTVAGRAFSTTTILRSSSEEARGQRLWLPLLDGTERLGVIGMSFESEAVSEATVLVCERYAHLAAMLIATKNAYGDAFETIRRRRPMTIAAELLWQLAPPLVFATERLVVAGMLEPCYDNGGDALDYAVNDGVLHVGVFDAMGHGLAAAGVAAFALSAYRHSRRRGFGLLETYAAMDEAVGEQYPRRAVRHGRHRTTGPQGRAPVVDQRRAPAAAGHPRRAAVAHADRATGRAAGDPAGGAVTGAGRRVLGAGRPAAALHRWIDRGAPP